MLMGLVSLVHFVSHINSILDTSNSDFYASINLLSHLSTDLQSIQSHSGRELLSLPSLAPKNGLSETCTNNLCLMFESALTCPVMPLGGLNEICAQYFLGALLHCPIFPNNLFNAPYACITELSSIAAKIQGPDPAAALSGLFKGFVYGNFTANCGENCYQQYVTRANDFYAQCGEGIQASPLKTSYPVASTLSNFNQFRNQSCSTYSFLSTCRMQLICVLLSYFYLLLIYAAYNTKHENCLTLITSLSSGGLGVDLFSPTCDFFPDFPELNPVVFPGIYSTLHPSILYHTF